MNKIIVWIAVLLPGVLFAQNQVDSKKSTEVYVSIEVL